MCVKNSVHGGGGVCLSACWDTPPGQTATAVDGTQLTGMHSCLKIKFDLYMPPPSVNKAVHSGLETLRRRHQKSKTGVSVASQKGIMSSKNFKKFPVFPQ